MLFNFFFVNDIDNLDQDDIIPSDGRLQNLTYMLFNIFFSKIFRRGSNYYLNQAINAVYNSECVVLTLAICFIHSLGQNTITKKL